ncbi:nephrocystin-1 [Caerostris extrusa]|uniref:Nephrocystin-1 n=1 Tax=Caerostris extrusa TaxID=172846 RepID=A0AAV4S686_CAEEX|nr:nephrocystin-1 [Caerostris extrusa]
MLEGHLELENGRKLNSSIDSKSPFRKIISDESIDNLSITEETDLSKPLMDQFSQLTVNQELLPEGFRSSILFEMQKSSFYNLGNFMAPKLDETGISFSRASIMRRLC